MCKRGKIGILKNTVQIAFFSFIILILTAACNQDTGNVSPTRTMEIFLDSVRSGDFERANSFLYGDNDPFAFYEIDDEHKGLFRRLTFWGQSEAINGDTAEVTLTIRRANFIAVMEIVMAEASVMLQDGFPEDELPQVMEQLIYEHMTGRAAEMITSTITVPFVRDGDVWLIYADNVLINTVNGGILDFVQYIESN